MDDSPGLCTLSSIPLKKVKEQGPHQSPFRVLVFGWTRSPSLAYSFSLPVYPLGTVLTSLLPSC